jgi:hypothetical protein
MRQRVFPRTEGDRHGVPARVVAPQRRLARIAAVLRGRTRGIGTGASRKGGRDLRLAQRCRVAE